MTDHRKHTDTARTGRTRLLAAAVALAAAGGITVMVVSSGGKGSAFAETSLQDFVKIEDVEANVTEIEPRRGASTGTFRVDCGVNANGKFSPDNPVAQPGIKNGAEHVHDFVGNQAITADTPDEVLAEADTTCENEDRSSYFWPVVRIDEAVRADAETQAAALASTQPLVSCPRVADRLPAVGGGTMKQIKRELTRLDRQLAAANTSMAGSKGRVDATLNNAVIGSLRAERAASLKRISAMIKQSGGRPGSLVSLVDCEVSYDGMHAGGHSAATTKAGATKAGTKQARQAANASVRCPSVRDRLPDVPARAVDEVNRNLDLLDQQIAEADERLAGDRGGRQFADNAIMGPLRAKRAATLDRMAIAISRDAPRPTGLDGLAACTLRNADTLDRQDGNKDQRNEDDSRNQQNQEQQQGNQDQQGEEAAALPAPEGPDNELPGNTGGIVRPAEVLIEYRGNPTTKVTAMPTFLRALTGDAKPTSRGPANARATWTCSGFADRLSAKYPICPEGSQVMRVQDFPGCWDGENIDSENHRSHLAFADARSGACPEDFVAIPQLRISISYDIPQDVQVKGQFALDSFPEENHNPFSDHNDFVNVNSDQTMKQIVSCINDGKNCD